MYWRGLTCIVHAMCVFAHGNIIGVSIWHVCITLPVVHVHTRMIICASRACPNDAAATTS